MTVSSPRPRPTANAHRSEPPWLRVLVVAAVLLVLLDGFPAVAAAVAADSGLATRAVVFGVVTILVSIGFLATLTTAPGRSRRR